MLKIYLALFLVLTILAAETQRPPYRESLAGKMIQLSTSVYDINKNDTLPKDKCNECYKEFQQEDLVTSLTLLALIGYDKSINSVIVAFRGSDNKINWISDVMARFKPYDNSNACQRCLVHHGFQDDYQALRKFGLETSIKKALLRHPKAKIIFTGHSLGGALAQYAAVKLSDSLHADLASEIAIYSYGQPRVGNIPFGDHVNQKVPNNYRIIHNLDIVPHQASSSIKFGLVDRLFYNDDQLYYRHSGVQVWYDEQMQVIYQVCENDSDQCSNQVKNRDYTFDDHHSADYVKLYLRLYGKQDLPEL